MSPTTRIEVTPDPLKEFVLTVHNLVTGDMVHVSQPSTSPGVCVVTLDEHDLERWRKACALGRVQRGED
jgi:hypothetical protein